MFSWLLKTTILVYTVQTTIQKYIWFYFSNQFVDECEDWNLGNYWVGEAGHYFVMDLGCCQEISSVTLKNIQNEPAGHNRLPDRWIQSIGLTQK